MPQVEGDLLHPDLVIPPTQVEEQEMGAHPALHREITGHRRVEAAGNQRKYRVQAGHRVATRPAVAPSDDKQRLFADLQVHRHLRVHQPDSGRSGSRQQCRAHLPLHVNRGKGMAPGSLAADCEMPAHQARRILGQDIIRNLAKFRQRVLADLEYIDDAGHAAHGIHHQCKRPGVLQRRFHAQSVPAGFHHHSRIKFPQHLAQIRQQPGDKVAPHRLALDSDFREVLDNKFHRRHNIASGRVHSIRTRGGVLCVSGGQSGPVAAERTNIVHFCFILVRRQSDHDNPS